MWWGLISTVFNDFLGPKTVKFFEFGLVESREKLFSSFSRPGTARNASGEPWAPPGCTPGCVCGGVHSGWFFEDFDSKNRPGTPKKHDSRAVSGVFPGPYGHRVHFPAPGGHAGTVCGAVGGGFPSPLEPPRNRLTHGFFASDIYKIKPSDPMGF